MKHVTRAIALLLLLPLAITAVFAIVIKDRPKAHYDSGSVVVEWSTADESGVKKFDVLRAQVKGDAPGEFRVVGSIDAVGRGSDYSFTDRDVFKDAGGVFVYKVRVIFRDGTFSDSQVSQSTPVLSSTAKRTWGSIKAMFR
jgi:hypothetical protein